MPLRSASAHKGLFGNVLVVGGDYGLAGAAAMAAESALRCGAGLVQVATRPEHVSAVVARTPEVMPRGVVSSDEFAPMVEAADVLVVGPGLGQSPWSIELLRLSLACGKPLVLDADALNLLAAGTLGNIRSAQLIGCSRHTLAKPLVCLGLALHRCSQTALPPSVLCSSATAGSLS